MQIFDQTLDAPWSPLGKMEVKGSLTQALTWKNTRAHPTNTIVWNTLTTDPLRHPSSAAQLHP